MPYYFDMVDPPKDQTQLFEKLQEIWDIIHYDLMNVRFETEEEALDQRYRKSLDPDDMRVDSWNVARYRETDDRENLLHFHGQALDALGTTEIAIQQGRLDAEFWYQWTMLISCHGFVTAALMARGDDLQSKRAGKASAEATNLDNHKIWYSHYYLKARKAGHNHPDAEDMMLALILGIIEQSDSAYQGVDVEWFKKIIDPHKRFLRSSFQQKNLSKKQMEELAIKPKATLPLMDIIFPNP